LVRIEQLYPFPQEAINKILTIYDSKVELVWAQEEPANMGAWNFLQRKWEGKTLQCVSRHESGSPASGSMKRFQQRQKLIIDTVFN
jgi:2-oxoglutarate dehydrogenase E1 component